MIAVIRSRSAACRASARRYASPFLVPAPDTHFRTDLTSVPTVFLWLVPTVGTHLPAALLHDALVYDEDEPKTYQGPDTTPEEADRIFRDAMPGLGVARIRRWLSDRLDTVRA